MSKESKYVCEKREVWFEKPGRLLGLLMESMENYGCKTLLHKENSIYVVQLKCSTDEGLECIANIKAEMIGDVPPELHGYARMASAKGFGRVYIVIETSSGCAGLCDTIEKLLLRGGG